MSDYQEHYHCNLCGKYCLTDEEAKTCFKTHGEIDTLRFIVFWLNLMLTVSSDSKYSKRINKYFRKFSGKSDWLKDIIVDAVERFDIIEPEEYLNE